MEQEVTAEQKQKLNKLGTKFLFIGILTGISHGVMLVLINFITVMAAQIFEIPEPIALIASLVGGFLVMRRMFSITLENHDRFKDESKKIVEQK